MKKESSKDKTKKLYILLLVLGSVSLLLGGAFAWLQVMLTATKEQHLTAGTLVLVLSDTASAGISLQKAVPMLDEVALKQSGYTFTLKNTGTVTSEYTIYLDDVLLEAGETRLSDGKMKYNFSRVDGPSTTQLLSEAGMNPNRVLETGTIAPGVTYTYTLKLWLDSNASNESMGKVFRGKIRIEASQQIETNTISEKLFMEANLTDQCKTYNDGTDTFLVGNCNRNYIWYSGKLWRVVSKNNQTGTVKLITEEGITTSYYNVYGSYDSVASFTDSIMDQWLIEEFYPTLSKPEKYIVENFSWNIGQEETTMTVPSKEVEEISKLIRAVGTLNAYEFYTVYQQSGTYVSPESNYLNNNQPFWLLTTQNIEEAMSNLAYYGTTIGLNTSSYMNSNPIRPCINLKAEIQVLSGSGSMTDPYHIEQKNFVNGTTYLNTRASGEYVRFDDELYRIVRAEGNITKITAVAASEKLGLVQFATSANSDFATAEVKTTLENYYQSLYEKEKNLIEPNTTWYTQTMFDYNTNYKYLICANAVVGINTIDCPKTTKSVAANIGLPRIGEIFTNALRGETKESWLLTGYDKTRGRILRKSGGSSIMVDPTSKYGVRPTMYLKSGVKIASSNKGDGTFERPFDIEI